jgi:hypothetical protein
MMFYDIAKGGDGDGCHEGVRACACARSRKLQKATHETNIFLPVIVRSLHAWAQHTPRSADGADCVQCSVHIVCGARSTSLTSLTYLHHVVDTFPMLMHAGGMLARSRSRSRSAAGTVARMDAGFVSCRFTLPARRVWGNHTTCTQDESSETPKSPRCACTMRDMILSVAVAWKWLWRGPGPGPGPGRGLSHIPNFSVLFKR